MAKQDDYTRYTIRIPTPLYERVKEAAGEKSVNAEVIAALDDYVAREAQREEGYRWIPPDQQVPPQLLWGLDQIAKAQGVPLNIMLDVAVSYFIAEKEAEMAEGDAQMEADETLSDMMARAENAAADVPGASVKFIDMNKPKANKRIGSLVPRRSKGGKALSDAEMQELKDAVSATVAQELARLLGRE